ncbi:uncharacterized protein GGS22DRAFT_147123 [Annulohypoxylon maeteangense]|uniref:uncharacterized protein n=1 Tax=Annulohypoxylon maeteangense TaxID=1927788 RepID=UPI002008A5A8|nr:uncharacterized protein GGS22DRAFT_147123 [Annulohypoxylon maeteangense]KAI0884812.1 hypothetical protein GGS22DRAFT_147123 [Annulohypoxylon maeteangense]
MDSNIKRALNGLSATTYRSRIPLSNRSNISKTPTYQRSPEALWDRKDSSKSQPSSHNSIYDAAWASDPGDAIRSPYQTPDPALVPISTPTKTNRPMTPTSQSSPIDLNSESPLSRLEQSASTSTFDTQFLYGHGTELAPIAEQRSIATLRTGSSLAGSNISPLLKHQPSSLSTSSKATPNEPSNQNTPPRHLLRRRQLSFSLDDLSASPNPNPHRRCSSGSRRPSGEASEPGGSSAVDNPGVNGPRIPRLRTISKRHSPPTVETVDIHAYPQKPVYPPHQAPATPLAYAEWLSAQGGRSASHHYPGRASAAVFEQPFRGVRSGHGNLETHPYMRGTSIARPAPGPRSAFDGILGCADGEGSVGRGGVLRGLRVRGSPDVGGSCAVARCFDDIPRVEREAWVCKACGRPADQRWSLLATVVGSGAGGRRGEEWCTRCCWRKMVYIWCFCEPLGDTDGR